MKSELLFRFFEGKTTFKEEKQIREWLDASPDHKKQFLKERKAFDVLLIHGSTEAEKAATSAPFISSNKSILNLLKIAAALIIGFLSAWYTIDYFHKRNLNSQLQTIHVPAGQRMNIVLPDGTDIWLNAKTTIQYPVTFNTKERKIYLDGQAFFNVNSDKKRPFIVSTTKGDIRALGTQFDVLAYKNSNEYETMLMEGSVEVSLSLDANQSSTLPIRLTPNNKTILTNGTLAAVSVIDYSPYQWKEGLISFKNETFNDIVRSFEKIYDVKIIIQDTRINQQALYTGKFRMIDGVDYALRVLQKDIRFSFERKADSSVIYIR